jgi:hypothetical protein
MGACCSASDSAGGVLGGGEKKKTPTGSSLTPFEDFSSLSTRSKKSTAEKLETVTEEKENQGGSPNQGTRPLSDGRKSPHGSPKTGRVGSTKSRDGLLTQSTTARGNEYQQAHSTLTQSGSSTMLSDDEVIMTIPFFDALDMKHVKILRSFFTRRVYAPKEVVLAEGLPLGQQVFHIIINGRVEMCAKYVTTRQESAWISSQHVR